MKLRRRELTLVLLILLLLIGVTLRTPTFLSWGNLGDILDDTAILVMVALG